MKLLLKSLFVTALVAVVMGCTKNGADNGNSLTTPEFTANSNENSIVVSWTAVTGAAYYEIKLDEGAAEKTDKLVHVFEGLQWGKTYTVALRAVSANEQTIASSEFKTKTITIAERTAPVYREWYPQNNVPASAISNNGRWVVGGYERQGMIIDLTTDEVTMVESFEFMDVDDSGVAVGSYHGEAMDGVAALYIDGTAVTVDLSNLTPNNSMSCLTGITPDGTYAIGWYWEYDSSSYYAGLYGSIVPFCYDIIKDKVTTPAAADRLYNEIGGISLSSVAPDRTILGCEQSYAMFSVLWKDEYTPYEYICFEYDADYNPTFSFGDTQNRMSQNGKFVYGIGKTFLEGGYGETGQPAAYNCETGELYLFSGVGSVTAMTDDGIAFLNDVPYYLGTTSFVIDVNKGEPYEQKPIIDYLLDEYSIDLYNYIQEGVITIGTSQDGRKLLGITNTDSGWLTYVIDLDGAPMN